MSGRMGAMEWRAWGHESAGRGAGTQRKRYKHEWSKAVRAAGALASKQAAERCGPAQDSVQGSGSRLAERGQGAVSARLGTALSRCCAAPRRAAPPSAGSSRAARSRRLASGGRSAESGQDVVGAGDGEGAALLQVQHLDGAVVHQHGIPAAQEGAWRVGG